MEVLELVKCLKGNKDVDLNLVECFSLSVQSFNILKIQRWMKVVDGEAEIPSEILEILRLSDGTPVLFFAIPFECKLGLV